MAWLQRACQHRQRPFGFHAASLVTLAASVGRRFSGSLRRRRGLHGLAIGNDLLGP